MAKTRVNRQMLATARLLENYAVTAQLVLDHLAEERRALDWHPSSTMGDGMPTGSSELTSVERVANAAMMLDRGRDQILDDIATIASVIGSAMVVANDLLGQRAPVLSADKVLCTCAGREGAEVWGHPECERLPVRGPLCEACYRREYRWRSARSMPAREDQFA